MPNDVSPVNAILSSPIIHMGGGIPTSVGGGGGSSMAGAGAGGSDFDMYGFDPSLDPELALAIRASTEEARANEEARIRAAQDQVSLLYPFSEGFLNDCFF